jgi:DNA repair protein RadC
MLLKEHCLSELYNADSRKIKDKLGFTPIRAKKLAAAIELTKRFQDTRKPFKKKMDDPVNVWNYVKDSMKHLDYEEFRVLILGARFEVLKMVTIAKGQRGSCIVHTCDIFREAILEKAENIILIHNHPSGNPKESPEDCAMTRRVKSAGDLLGIKILDHVIIGSEGYCSLKEEGLIV